MNYLKVYCNLIRKGEKRGYTRKKAKKLGLYLEGHHTFPVSIFGDNERIVFLTAREHYIAHALLEKICFKRYGIHHNRTIKMNFAHIAMKCKNKYINSYLYEKSKLRRKELIKENKLNTGEKNSFYGKKHSEKSKNQMRKSREKLGKEFLTECGKRGGTSCKENKLGIFKLSKKDLQNIAKKNQDLGIGIFSLTVEQKREYGKISGKAAGLKAKEMGVGIFNLSKQERKENAIKGGKVAGKITSSQKWICLETGYITNAGALTNYQKAKGIDTSRRAKLE